MLSPALKALPRCDACVWWEKDYGMWTVTGWTRMGRDDGLCLYDRARRLRKQAGDRCGCFAPKESARA